jgi:hypothetical protein
MASGTGTTRRTRRGGVTNLFSLRDVKETNLRMLSFIASDQIPQKFWTEVSRTCEAEECERAKPEAERQDVVFELPELNAEEATLVRNELMVLIHRMEGSQDDSLLLLFTAVAKVLIARLSPAIAAANAERRAAMN